MDVKRAKVIAYNAIVMWREDSYISYEDDEFMERVMEELGITEKEYKEIMEVQ